MSDDALRDCEPAETNLPGFNPIPIHPPTVSPWGMREASMELYDACLRIVEVANQIEANPAALEAMDSELKVQLTMTRLLAQQALDRARRCS